MKLSVEFEWMTDPETPAFDLLSPVGSQGYIYIAWVNELYYGILTTLCSTTIRERKTCKSLDDGKAKVMEYLRSIGALAGPEVDAATEMLDALKEVSEDLEEIEYTPPHQIGVINSFCSVCQQDLGDCAADCLLDRACKTARAAIAKAEGHGS